jgi:hypothetical protein
MWCNYISKCGAVGCGGVGCGGVWWGGVGCGGVEWGGICHREFYPLFMAPESSKVEDFIPTSDLFPQPTKTSILSILNTHSQHLKHPFSAS